MSKKQQVEKEIIQILKNAEEHLQSLADRVGDLRDAHEFPYLIAEIRRLKRAGKVKNITTAWLQRKLKVGYAKAARLKEYFEK